MTLRNIITSTAAGIANLIRFGVSMIPSAVFMGGLYMMWLGIAAQFGQSTAQITIGAILFLLPLLAKLRGRI